MPTDPRGLRSDAPLLDAWLRFQETAPTPFTIPGHKQRRDLVGDVVAGDVPLYAGLDTMKLSAGVLVEAEARAARLWGADLCRFSVGGATHLNQALALALAEGASGPRDGDAPDNGSVVVSRTLHRSRMRLRCSLTCYSSCPAGTWRPSKSRIRPLPREARRRLRTTRQRPQQHPA